MDFVFKIAAQAGAGIMLTGRSLVKCFSRGGYNVIGYPEYPSLIRGGHNTVQVRVSDGPINSPLQQQDLLIALNKDALFYHMSSMKSRGVIIHDQLIDTSKSRIREDVRMVPLPLSELTQAAGGTEQMKNMAALGAALGMIEYSFDILEGIIRDELKRKGEDIIKQNINVAKAAYEHAKAHNGDFHKIRPLAEQRKLVITGNEAIALGAVKGGMKFFAAYPMTPASSILHYLAENERRFDLVVKQTEDEIAAINYAVGAAFAGARTMTGTSGGGFSLMVEALGMAAMSETPVVVALAQRSGPSTGLPTWTEQGDLRFALHASQGDFLRVVLAPGDVQECFFLAAEAFNLAEKYQIPVLLLSDKHLSETFFSAEQFDQSKVRIERGKIAKRLPGLEPLERWKRYSFAADGVSPRAFPGMPNGMHVGTSYEHDERGFSSESFIMRTRQVDKRASKIKKLLKDIPPPAIYGPEDAEVSLIGWGSTKLAAVDALRFLKEKGITANYIHFSYLYPLNERMVRKLLKKAKVRIIVENNSTAQFAGMLRQYTGVRMDFCILRYDARPFFPENITEEITKLRDAGYKSRQKRIVVCEKEDLEYYNPQRHGL
ncbi:MAG: 2-oxoacid:acceptor oxidoreductase subunit alpha [Candidatus Aenigmatarchaeota archaeon]